MDIAVQSMLCYEANEVKLVAMREEKCRLGQRSVTRHSIGNGRNI